MPTCSIFDDITINNPAFIEMYVDHMDAKNGESSFKSRNSNIKIATSKDIDRIWALRRKRREELKLKEGEEHGEQNSSL